MSKILHRNLKILEIQNWKIPGFSKQIRNTNCVTLD